MRSHGWGGNTPRSDEEAIDRILNAADQIIAERGSAMRIADVARELAVTRQTVYRYFPSTDALLVACAMRSADGFLDQLAAHLRDYDEPAAAMVEGVAFTIEALAHEDTIEFLFNQRERGGRERGSVPSITSDTARAFGTALLHRLEVDWEAHGFDDVSLDRLAEFGLRSIHSLLLDPGSPPHQGAELREFLALWLGPAVIRLQRERSAAS
ncbi:TetR/AcrR family transcriptional regulator [Mycolicibacterium iranicum]|uniref:Helix-turn-helix domain containing protein n=1 Tax=Mycolicibacterium iranicum TaxID=912594 RepID=A0ABT4HGY5_MYCIR|nr:TetR/AcrR family transcriptional regulator [Mycolicibacterium iranicum]MCZ0729466.1 helix-turn-helix domain containing protein [Mycolicibacterium iranicum]